MDIKLHNTLTNKLETFKPIKEGILTMYNCGPTVYDSAHIGNLRAYVTNDIIRRTFEYFGYEVKQVTNITDVGHISGDGDSGDDKMTKALKREGKPLTLDAMREVATVYMNDFIDDLKSLNIELPEVFPRASDHMNEDIDLARELDKKGYVYTISDGVYFDTSKFPSYGKLGNIDIASQRAGARIEVNNEKRNNSDFAVWKFDQNIGWDSPWGKGFPGWHIECSAMSRKYLGQPFDIHTGAIDLIPVHHNNEIAQSESAYGVPLANYWLHNAFLNVEGGKMAKSEGNFVILDSLVKRSLSALSYRYWLLTAHYRSPIVFTFDALQAAQNALIRLIGIVMKLPTSGAINTTYKQRFDEYMSNDFDTPGALALVWDIVKDTSLSPGDKRTTIVSFDNIFGLNLSTVKNIDAVDIPAEITVLAEARQEARASKDWKKADALRVEINNRGFDIVDSNDGFVVISK